MVLLSVPFKFRRFPCGSHQTGVRSQFPFPERFVQQL